MLLGFKHRSDVGSAQMVRPNFSQLKGATATVNVIESTRMNAWSVRVSAPLIRVMGVLA